MNSKTLLAVAAFAAFAGAAAHADDNHAESPGFQSTKTRAQVRAELVEYQKSGVNPLLNDYAPVAHFESGSTKTRAQVRAEYLAVRDQVDAMNGESSGWGYLPGALVPAYKHSVVVGVPVNAQ